MYVQQNQDGTFYLEAQSSEDNNTVCIISEMMYALAKQGRVDEDLANRHGGVEKAGGFFNCVTIPGMEFVELANAGLDRPARSDVDTSPLLGTSGGLQ